MMYKTRYTKVKKRKIIKKRKLYKNTQDGIEKIVQKNNEFCQSYFDRKNRIKNNWMKS